MSVASVIPSSRWVEQRLVQQTRAANAHVIVELGPGTGGTTRAMLRALPPEGRLLAIELSEVFAARLRRTVLDPRLIVEQGSAECIAEYLAKHRLPAADAVFSGIPFSTMPVAVGERIAAAVAQSLAPGGRFVAYQSSAQVAQRITPLLGPAEHAWEWRNMPPLQFFTWTRPAG